MSPTNKDNVKESSNQFKESVDRYLEEQTQQYKDIASNIFQTTEKINESVNKFQEDNRRIFEKNADTCRDSQEEISKIIQEISNNVLELQKNVFKTYQLSLVLIH
jgi:methyl-accepting chemotaxis protein